MFLLVLFICLATELDQYTAEGSLTIDDLRTTRPEIQQQIVDIHNLFRRNVDPSAENMVKMKWNEKLEANARKWAEKCILEHSSDASRVVEGKQCGENLFMASKCFPWDYVIKAWYDEKNDFEYEKGATRQGAVVGHYTQLVWATTSEVGCAVAHCPKQPVYKCYNVCQYSPAGNIHGQLNKPYRKGPPCGECPNHCSTGLCTNPCEHQNNYTNCDTLTQNYGCDHPKLKDTCKASCHCEGKIR